MSEFLRRNTSTRWVDKDGKRVKPDTAGARKVNVKSEWWYGVFQGAGGKTERVRLAKDKRAARAMLADLVRARERDGAGLVDPFKAHKSRPLAEHVADYGADLTARGRDAAYIKATTNDLTNAFRALVWKSAHDFHPVKLSEWVLTLPVGNTRKNGYLNAVAQFANWLVSKHRLGANPFTSIARHERQPGRSRRALSDDQLDELFTAARERPLKARQTLKSGPNKGKVGAKLSDATRAKYERLGHERWLIFRFATLTGLRRGEVAALEVRHLTLDAVGGPEFTLPGEHTKNGDDAHLPLSKTLAGDLRQWLTLTGRSGSDKVFEVECPTAAIAGLKRDLEAADIRYFDGKGRVFDWHSFRVQTATLLTAAGVHERIRMLYMRHADRHLTDHYDDAEQHWQRLRHAADALPTFPYRNSTTRQARTEALSELLADSTFWQPPV